MHCLVSDLLVLTNRAWLIATIGFQTNILDICSDQAWMKGMWLCKRSVAGFDKHLPGGIWSGTCEADDSSAASALRKAAMSIAELAGAGAAGAGAAALSAFVPRLAPLAARRPRMLISAWSTHFKSQQPNCHSSSKRYPFKADWPLFTHVC